MPPRAAEALIIEPVRLSGMQIERQDDRAWASWQAAPLSANMSRSGWPGKSPICVESLLKVRWWHGRSAGPFIARAADGRQPGAPSKSLVALKSTIQRT